jgi:hypothetical protein
MRTETPSVTVTPPSDTNGSTAAAAATGGGEAPPASPTANGARTVHVEAKVPRAKDAAKHKAGGGNVKIGNAINPSITYINHILPLYIHSTQPAHFLIISLTRRIHSL